MSDLSRPVEHDFDNTQVGAQCIDLDPTIPGVAQPGNQEKKNKKNCPQLSTTVVKWNNAPGFDPDLDMNRHEIRFVK